VHSLTGRITLKALYKAFKAVKRNRGAAGLDKQSIKMFEANLEENLLALMRDLKSGTYQAIPLRRMYIPKGKGAVRPLGIPAVRCRVAQEVIRALIEPIFEPTFHDHSHGFRRHHSCHTAPWQLVELHRQGFRVVVDADLKGFFDSIPHQLILALVAREIADGNILALIKKFLQAGVMENGEVVLKVNRVIRGTVRYFATAFTTCLGQFNELDRWVRMRIRCMKVKRIWKTDNRRLKSRHIMRMGFVTCREVYLSAR
jgi:retron-type reverse transcriptase